MQRRVREEQAWASSELERAGETHGETTVRTRFPKRLRHEWARMCRTLRDLLAASNAEAMQTNARAPPWRNQLLQVPFSRAFSNRAGPPFFFLG